MMDHLQKMQHPMDRHMHPILRQHIQDKCCMAHLDPSASCCMYRRHSELGVHSRCGSTGTPHPQCSEGTPSHLSQHLPNLVVFVFLRSGHQKHPKHLQAKGGRMSARLP